MTAGLVPRPLYSLPDKHVVILACGHFRIISLRELSIYPGDLEGIHMQCLWCRRSTLLTEEECWRLVLKGFPAPPGASITA
jgi:hypothetical protein